MKKDILKENDKVQVSIKASFDPRSFFKSGPGLFVWSDFTERILEKAEPLKEDSDRMIGSYNLIESSSDNTIESALPEKPLFTESEACAIIADLISKQPKGEEGALLSNGYTNLFYTPSFVVCGRWHSVHGLWSVDAWGRGGRRWVAGRRVFSPAIDR